MSSLKYYFKLVTFQHMLMAGLSTWVTAILSGGGDWSANTKLFASGVMTLGIMGASLYHFGAAHYMYARKSEQFANTDQNTVAKLIILGLICISIAIVASLVYLNSACQLIVLIDSLIIILYSRVLSRYWWTKNPLIAFVCTSPILLGWFTGQRLHPYVPHVIFAVFFAFLTREIVKDVQDRIANHGLRLTLPLWLGVAKARTIAGITMVIAVIFLLILYLNIRVMTWPAISLCSLALLPYSLALYSLLFNKQGGHEKKESAYIIKGTACLLVLFLSFVL